MAWVVDRLLAGTNVQRQFIVSHAGPPRNESFKYWTTRLIRVKLRVLSGIQNQLVTPLSRSELCFKVCLDRRLNYLGKYFLVWINNAIWGTYTLKMCCERKELSNRFESILSGFSIDNLRGFSSW